MGQTNNLEDCNKQLLKPEFLKKYITEVEEEDLNEFSVQLYEFTKLILDKLKDEN